jgi:hypothetical protein
MSPVGQALDIDAVLETISVALVAGIRLLVAFSTAPVGASHAHEGQAPGRVSGRYLRPLGVARLAPCRVGEASSPILLRRLLDASGGILAAGSLAWASSLTAPIRTLRPRPAAPSAWRRTDRVGTAMRECAHVNGEIR